jgi:hypothetical protein
MALASLLRTAFSSAALSVEKVVSQFFSSRHHFIFNVFFIIKRCCVIVNNKVETARIFKNLVNNRGELLQKLSYNKEKNNSCY